VGRDVELVDNGDGEKFATNEEDEGGGGHGAKSDVGLEGGGGGSEPTITPSL